MGKGFTMDSMTELFNSASNSEKVTDYLIRNIDIDEIVTNEKNEYSIQDIEELALSISLVGIRTNLEVEQTEDGKYKLISGERRYTAVKKLIEEEGREDLRKLPCRIIKTNENIKFDIPDEIKELWLLTTTNLQREKTDGDRLVDIRNQKKIYESLIEAGVELTGKQRDLIAAALKMSPSQVQRYEFVDKNLSTKLKQGFEKNEIPLTVAVEVAKQGEAEQKELGKVLSKKGKLTKNDIEEVKKKINEKADKKRNIKKSELEYLYSLKSEVEEVAEEFEVTEQQYEKLETAKKIILQQQEIISTILLLTKKD